MTKLPGLRKALPRTALVFAVLLALVAVDAAEAQQDNGNNSSQSSGKQRDRNYGVGGTSLTLRDIWGPAEMPPAPTDFGPHFDYPPQDTLNGVPNQAPYPN
jgi:hypothetical protein